MADGPYLLGIDMGTGGARAGVFDTEGNELASVATEWVTDFPRSGRAEQSPKQWWECIIASVRGAVEKSGVPADAIVGIGVDSTSATVVAVDKNNNVLRPALLWMDVRAAAEADQLAATGDPALQYSGFGPVSAEWGTPKSMWLRANEPEVFEEAAVIADCTDWLINRLTGEWTMSINHAACKYFYDSDNGGWPTSLYEQAGAAEILDKFPKTLLPLGAKSIFATMRDNGYPPEQIVVSGGPAKSDFWMQMHADVSNVPMIFTRNSEGPILGSAMMGGMAAGLFDDLPAAAKAMVHTVKEIQPNAQAHADYQYYYQAYLDTYPAMKELMNNMVRHIDGN